MVELALIMPILLFLILGIVDFGRVMNYWNDTNQMAADAARFAAVNRNPGADSATPIGFREWVRSQAETVELQTGKLADGTTDSPSTRGNLLKICVSAPNGTSVGNPLKVTVTQRFFLIPFLGQRLQWPAVDINGEAVMRLEQPYTGPLGCDPA